MQQLQTVDADTLLYKPIEKPSFVVDGLIPTGLSLFCGSQKIGKSWLMLKLCLCVSQGIPLWDMQTLEGDVLYLCLEDTFCRIQDRLFRLTDEASGRLHFAVASSKLSDGLIVQLEDYLKAYPDSRLVVINTLQKIRTASKDNAYANDYGDISLLKDFADRHFLSVVVVHHIRKQNDSDVFNKVSGTTGLTGSADATFVLEKESRASDTAKLFVTGRDTPYQELTLRFRDCSWELVKRQTQEQLAAAEIPPVLFRVVSFMQGRQVWSGTATELLEVMGKSGELSTVITKWLNEYRGRSKSRNRGASLERNPGVTIEIQQSDSSTGMSDTIDGTCDIGMASRELKDSEIEKGLTATIIAMDGITVIVNNDCPINNFTICILFPCFCPYQQVTRESFSYSVFIA